MMNNALRVATLVALGCGGGDDSPTVDAPPPAPPDAGSEPDATSGLCLVPGALGDPGALVGDALESPSGTAFYFVANLDTEVPGDHLWVELYQGTSTFPAGIVPGTYDLSGDNSTYATCGVCVWVYADWNKTDDAPAYYLANAGTVIVTEATTGMTGSLANVELQHVAVNWNDFTTTPHEDGCTTTLDAASWDDEY